MKTTTIAMATGLVLFSTFALAKTGHHRSVVRTHRGTPNYAHPDGPPTWSGAAKGYAVPGWTDEETQYWIDNATGPKD
jgi:hypothetical protein